MSEDLFTKKFSLKAEEVGDGEITAYLTTFENEDKVGDIIAKGALDKFVSNFDPEQKKLPMLYSHDVSSIIGEWKTLSVDEKGVIGTGIIYTEVTQGSDVYKLLKRGAVASVSIGFKSSNWEWINEDTFARKFHEIELVETSVVLNPANPEAKILSVKSEDGFIETKALKTVLKEAGLSRNEIDALFNQGWKGLKSLREEDLETQAFIEAVKNFKL